MHKTIEPTYKTKLGTGVFMAGAILHKFECSNCGEYVECYGPPPKRNDCPRDPNGRHCWLDLPE